MKSFILILLNISCTLLILTDLRSQDNVKNFEWKEGLWATETSKGKLFEEWKRYEDSYKGRSFKLNGLDTILIEETEILTTKEGVYYIPTVADQNNGKAIKFKLTDMSKGFVFENPLHDFPQRITYKFLPNGNFNASIETLDKTKKLEYLFVKQ